MSQIEKTVFISYRRENILGALAIYQDLTHHGYDVFFDYESIASGDFEQVILGNIKARAHFLVVLTPSALERTAEPGDWLRREIETALDTRRNILPLMLEGFSFSSPTINKYLSGKLARLKSYNALPIPAAYFEEGMERLRRRYLNVPLEAVLHSLSDGVRQATLAQQSAASNASAVGQQELSAQAWFEKGYTQAKMGQFSEAIHSYCEAIRLKPDNALAYFNRGLTCAVQGDLEDCISDYSEAIRLNPDNALAYINRGLARAKQGDLEDTNSDYNEAIRLNPDNALAYINRGLARAKQGVLEGAISDYDGAIRLKPEDADAYNSCGIARYNQGDLEGAIDDYDQALRLQPYDASVYYNRGLALEKKGDKVGARGDFEMAKLLRKK
jgi:tetratricopeptide (TPR) repeat protein